VDISSFNDNEYEKKIHLPLKCFICKIDVSCTNLNHHILSNDFNNLHIETSSQNLLHVIMKHAMDYYKNIIIPMIAS
jgi:hypothetical protein